MTTSTPTTPTTNAGSWARRSLTVAAAVLAPVALWFLAVGGAGVDLTASPGGRPQEVGVGAVAVAGLVSAVAAWGLLAVLERTVARPRRVWTTVACVVLVLSLAGPLTSGAAPVAVLVLEGLHLVVGAVVVWGLGRSARA